MIKCAKRCLKKMLGVSRVTYDELSTLIVEVETILNSRPSLKCIPMTSRNLLLLLTRWPTADCCQYQMIRSHQRTKRRTIIMSIFTRRERYLAQLLGHFWRRWRKEYLLELREHHNMSVRRNNLSQILLGDIVTVMDD